MFKIITFAVLTLVLIYISRTSLKAPRSHGFYRFFSWEFILALLLLNIEKWFYMPGAWHQLISWFLLLVSLIPLALGLRTLIGRGRPVKQREGEPQLLAIEKTSVLVTTGIYQYIRHPLYSSLLSLTWGIFFKDPTGLGLVLAIVATIFLVVTARVDEAECLRYFGSEYQEYMKQTKRFIPFVF